MNIKKLCVFVLILGCSMSITSMPQNSTSSEPSSTTSSSGVQAVLDNLAALYRNTHQFISNTYQKIKDRILGSSSTTGTDSGPTDQGDSTDEQQREEESTPDPKEWGYEWGTTHFEDAPE